jgi:exopolysaccharide production protein ExoZ
MVVACHAAGQVGLTGPMVLQSGIEVFFIVSGFVMWTVSAKDTGAPGPFMARRLARIVPLYWVLTLLVAATAVTAPHVLQSIRLEGAHFMASLLFVAWPNPVPGVGLRPLLIPGWTLNYEMAFYALVAASLWAPGRWRPVSVIGALLGAAMIGQLLPPDASIARFYTSPFVVDFALGIILALVVKAAPERAKNSGALIFAAGALGLIAGMVIDPSASVRLVWFGLPMFLVVLGAVFWEDAKPRRVVTPLKVLGDASYSLYLIHTLVLSALAQGWRRMSLSVLPPEAFVVLGLAASVVTGVLLHMLVEKPLTRWVQVRVASLLSPAAVLPQHGLEHRSRREQSKYSI